jgi:hypothetical protein
MLTEVELYRNPKMMATTSADSQSAARSFLPVFSQLASLRVAPGARQSGLLIPDRSRQDPELESGLIPSRSRRGGQAIPSRFGIKSGSRRVSPLDFGIRKKNLNSPVETSRGRVGGRTPRNSATEDCQDYPDCEPEPLLGRAQTIKRSSKLIEHVLGLNPSFTGKQPQFAENLTTYLPPRTTVTS